MNVKKSRTVVHVCVNMIIIKTIVVTMLSSSTKRNDVSRITTSTRRGERKTLEECEKEKNIRCSNTSLSEVFLLDECFVGLDLAGLLELLNVGALSPAAELSKVAEVGVLAVGPEAENTESGGNNNALLVLVEVWDTLSSSQTTESLHTAGCLVREHATD